jgi:hypothetical protein
MPTLVWVESALEHFYEGHSRVTSTGHYLSEPPLKSGPDTAGQGQFALVHSPCRRCNRLSRLSLHRKPLRIGRETCTLPST